MYENIDHPIFVIGAPKAGSSSLHDLFATIPGLSVPTIKDTHYLSRHDFSLTQYSEYFKGGGRLVEVDQNAGRYKQTFDNIAQNFRSAYVVYVVRDSKARVHSAIRWLLKVQHCRSVEECFLQEEDWIVGHGDYETAIESLRALSVSSEIIPVVVRFEKLISSREVLKQLLSLLEVDDSFGSSLPRSNEAGVARFYGLTMLAKKVAVGVRGTPFETAVLSLKNVRFFQKIMFKKGALDVGTIDDQFLQGFYDRQDSFIRDLFGPSSIVFFEKGNVIQLK